MKKLILVFLIVFFMISLNVSALSAYAEDEHGTVDEITGEDLGDFDVKLSYYNEILYSSGAYRAFEIIFDKYFVENNLTVDGSKIDFLTPIAESIAKLGYTVTVNITNNSLVGEASFDSLTDLYIVLGVTGYESNENNYVTQSSFLYTDTFIKQNSPFNGIEESDSTLKDVIDYFYTLGVERNHILLNYTYGTPYKIINTNADEITYSVANRLYLHSFDMTLDTVGREITLVQHSPNVIGWYSLAIIIALFVISVPLTVLFIKHDKNKGGFTNNGEQLQQ